MTTDNKISIWSEYLTDIARSLKLFEDALNESNRNIPGNYSDLAFVLDGKIDIQLDGESVGWIIAYDEDVESLTFQISEVADD